MRSRRAGRRSRWSRSDQFGITRTEVSHQHCWLNAPNLNGKRQSGRVETKRNHPHGHEIHIGPDPQAPAQQSGADQPEDKRGRGQAPEERRVPVSWEVLRIFIYPALAHGSFVLSSGIPSDRQNLGTFSDISVWFDRTLVETFKFPSGITCYTLAYRLACS